MSLNNGGGAYRRFTCLWLPVIQESPFQASFLQELAHGQGLGWEKRGRPAAASAGAALGATAAAKRTRVWEPGQPPWSASSRVMSNPEVQPRRVLSVSHSRDKLP